MELRSLANLAVRPGHIALALLLALPCVLGGVAGLRSAHAAAPPLNWTYRDRVHKFSFKMFRDYEPIPLTAGEDVAVCKLADPKGKGRARGTFDVEIEVVRVVTDGGNTPVTTGAGSGPLTPARLREIMEDQRKPKDIWGATLGRLWLPEEATRAIEHFKKEFVAIKSDDKPAIPGKLWQFQIPSQWQGEKLHITMAEFTKNRVSYGLFMTCGDKIAKDYERPFALIAKSFRWFDDKAKDVESLDVLEGVNITARRRLEIEKGMVRGWDAIVSPKKNYIVLYNTKQGTNHFLAKVIAERIEKIREQIYEVQFPPAQPIKTVSIVRVCKDQQEYRNYGGPGGSAGYWSPSDEELVFYDASPSKKPDDDTLSVLYHEAFHQYIFYSVGNVAPHSWFNEGHGDYYAGAEYRNNKFVIKPFAWRVGTVKGAIVQGRRPCTEVEDDDGRKLKQWESRGYTPLEDLVAFSQGEYYSYPSVSYAQGWSLIYFLREIVPKNRKYKEKWGGILDTYFNVLKDEVNREAPLLRGGEAKPDGGTPEGDLPRGSTPGGGVPQGDRPEGDKPDADGGDGETGGEDGDAPPDRKPPPVPERPGDEGEDGPPDVARVFFSGRGGPAALKKALDEAFKGVDWAEFEAAWLEATKRGR